MAGGVAGGIIGQLVIPVPVLGAVVGSLVGGIVGAGVGYGEGILIGELVEVIDNKIKEKKSEEEAKAEIEAPEKKLALPPSEQEKAPVVPQTSNYEVLHHLVFKYDKNLLKDNRFDYLKAYADHHAEASKLFSNTLITNANEEINEEDYEIYVLNETSEVVTQLNIEGLFDSNGQIDKRKSLEAFSANSLPSDLNVFFVDTDASEGKQN